MRTGAVFSSTSASLARRASCGLLPKHGLPTSFILARRRGIPLSQLGDAIE